MKYFLIPIILISTIKFAPLNAQCNMSFGGNRQGAFTSSCSGYTITGVVDDDITIAASCGDLIFVPPLADPETGTSSTTMLSAGQVIIYPNPTSGFFTIESNEILKDVEISIYNILGQRIYHMRSARTGKSEVDLSGMNNGVYIIKLRSENKLELTERLIKSE